MDWIYVAVGCVIPVIIALGIDLHLCTVLNYAAVDLEMTNREIAFYKRNQATKYQEEMVKSKDDEYSIQMARSSQVEVVEMASSPHRQQKATVVEEFDRN